MGVFSSFDKLAHRLINKNGQFVTWRIYKQDENAASPWNPHGSFTDYQFEEKKVKIVFFPISLQNNKTQSFINNSEQHKSDLFGYMASKDFTPDLKDVVMRGDKELRIEKIDVLSPNGEVDILYEIYFKSGEFYLAPS
jgi:hypothetical protein